MRKIEFASVHNRGGLVYMDKRGIPIGETTCLTFYSCRAGYCRKNCLFRGGGGFRPLHTGRGMFPLPPTLFLHFPFMYYLYLPSFTGRTFFMGSWFPFDSFRTGVVEGGWEARNQPDVQGGWRAGVIRIPERTNAGLSGIENWHGFPRRVNEVPSILFHGAEFIQILRGFSRG